MPGEPTNISDNRLAGKLNRDLSDLTRFIMSSPRYRFYAIPLPVIFALDSIFLLNFYEITAILASFFGGILLDQIMIRATRVFFPLRRTVFLNFFLLSSWSLLFILASAFGYLFRLPYPFIAFFIPLTAMVRAIVLYPYFSERPYSEIVPSFNSVIPFALVYFIFIPNTDLFEKVVAVSLIFAFAGVLFTNVSVLPFVKKYAVSPVKAMNFVLNFRSSKDVRDRGHEFFQELYSREREVPVKVVDVLKTDGTRKVAMIFPYVHPGPFGNYGSSNLPRRLAEKLGYSGGPLMVFHTATTNSNNCRGDDDVESVADAVRRALANAVNVELVSSYKRIKVAGHYVGLLRLGESLIVSFIPEERHFDDVYLDEALGFEASLKGAGIKEVICVDAQNSFAERATSLGELGRFVSGVTREYSRLSEAVNPEVGYGSSSLSTPGLGPMGVSAITFRSGRKSTVIVLTDSNNIMSGVMSKVRERKGPEFDHIELFTTDNHYVNENTLDMNPLGKRDNQDLVVDAIVAAIDQSLADAGPAVVKMGRSSAVVHMGEEGMFSDLQETVFQSLRLAKRMIAVSSVLGIVLSIAAFYFI